MKRCNTFLITLLTFLTSVFIFTNTANAQLVGTKTIPGDYPTISAAVTDLNTIGVGSGGVTFNVAAGYTENVTAPIIITATGVNGNAIVFQKSGVGANPLITRTDAGTLTTSTLGGDGDAIIRLNGTDYITFDAIDVSASDQGIEYGYMTHKPDGTNGCQFVTIKNSTVSLTKGTSGYVMGIYIGNGTTSVSSATGVTVTALSGINSNITISGNTIQNAHAGIYVRGSSASGFYDSNIIVGQSGAGNIIQNFGGGSATTTYGVYFIYVDNPSVSYNTIDNEAGGGTPHNSTFYCIFYSTVSGNVVGSNNTMKIANSAASSTSYYIYNTNTCTSENYSNNTFAQGSVPFGTGSTYFVGVSNATPTKTISGNSTIGTITKGGGSIYCVYNAGGASAGGTEVITNNTFSNINITASNSSTMYGIYSNTYAAHSKIMSNNILSNISNPLGTGSFYCLYALASVPNQVNNNSAYNITHGGTIYGLYLSGTGQAYNNNIYGLSTTSTGTGVVDGIYVSAGTLDIYNNFISDLNAPSSTSTTAGACGIYLSGGTTVNLDYNSVFLKYASLVAGNQSAALYIGSTSPTTLNMHNNIFVNDIDVTVGTRATAIRKGGTGLTNLVSVNNNLYYAGIPSAKNIIYYDGTNTDQTLSAYKSRVSPRESASVTEYPTFVNATTTPYDLHINPANPTQLESGGTPVATVTVDYDGNTRNATSPDIGADEFTGISLDLVSPTIVYTPLLNTASTLSRTLISSITDVGSGVPTSGLGLPVLYWKINLAGTWTGATSTYLTGSDYQFTFGSGVVTGDTVYYYVVAQDLATTPNVGAFPSAGASGFTASPPAASTPPTTPSRYIVSNVALAGDYTVGTAAFNKFIGTNIYFEKVVHKVMKEVDVLVTAPEIQNEKSGVTKNNSEISSPAKQLMEVEETTWIPMVDGIPYTGDLYVKKADHPEINFPDGIEGIYSTLTAAVADLNLRGVSGPTRFLLTDANYSVGETFPITIDIANENLPTAVNTVTIKPNAGVTSVVTGATAINVFGIYDDYIIFDGSNTVGGTTRDLTIVNTYLASTFNIGVVLWSSTKTATNITVKNCIIESDPAETSSYGLFLNYAGGGYNNTSFINNKIQNAKVGIQFVGFPAPGLITNNGLVSGNIIGDATKPVTLGGISCSYVDNLTITGNEIFGQATGNTNTSQYGVTLGASSTNCKIRKNNIHDFYYTGTSGYGCFGIRYNGDATTVTEISNNFIHNIKSDGDASSLTYTPSGIYIISGGNVQIYFNSIYMSGNTLGRGTSYDGRSSGISVATGVTLLNIRDNILQNSMGSFPGSARTNTTYGVFSSSDSLAYTNINYNDYFVNGVNPYVGFLGVNRTDLTAWQTATGKDLNSISVAAAFTDSTNLHIPNGTVTALESAGTPIVGITTDIDGQTRNASTPDIGADEFAGINPADALAGDYYIPQGAHPQGFSTLAAAITELNNFGVTSAVRFLIDDNLSEVGANLLITRSDLTSTNNLTIKPAATKTPTIMIAGCTTTAGPSQYSGISYSGASYITIDGSNTDGGTSRDLTIAMNDSLNGRIGIQIYGNTDYLVFKNFYLKFNLINLPNTSTRGVYANGQASGVADSVVFENCQIGDQSHAGAYAISITGSSGSSLYASKIHILNNDLYGTIRPVYFFYGGASGTTSEISGNIIQSPYAPPSGNVVWGMLFNTFNGTFNIHGNKLQKLISASTATNGVYGIGTLTSQPGVQMNIYNNFLGGDFQHTGTGVPASVDVISFQDNIPQANVYANTIVLNNINKPAAPRLTGIRWGGTATVNIKNNIVINENDAATAFALYNASGTFMSDYNDLYVSGTLANIGYSLTQVLKTFSAWQDTTGQDANSINVAAPFTSALDFHIPNGTLTPIESAGTPIALVTTDIDGQPRNASTPDIGADEFAGLLQILAPSNLTALADTFSVLLNWTDNSTNELGFYIERKNGDTLSVDPYVVIDTVGVDVVSYNDMGRTPLTTYTYRIQAFNLLGVSQYSNEVTATTIIPVELTSFAANVNDQEISIIWSTATELNNRGFDLERKLDGEWKKLAFVEGKGTTTEKSDYSYTDKFKYDGFQGTVQYRLKQLDFDGTITYSNVISVDVDFTPKEYTLYQNYPNPFNPSTTIKFALPFDSNVRITIYNMLGEQVEVIFDQVKEVGYHNVSWNASSLASGVYIYTIDAKSVDGLKTFNSVKKMMLVK
ncbi:MAG TPA: hypothetical protein DHV28_08645 [Ignavibacteriales bacterium]|nr:hypothetical protein [Ignavibacteriales bacterium]